MIWFTSDQHFGHANIIRHCNRPFASVDEMDREIVRRHNERVGVDDLVWHLGDFAWKEDRVERTIAALNGRHALVVGNHDRCHPCHSRHAQATVRYLKWGFVSIQDRMVRNVPGLGNVLLTHMPRTDGADPRYPEFRPNDWGGWIFHGHVHDRWKRNGNQINVGVDQWSFAPVSLDELVREALS